MFPFRTAVLTRVALLLGAVSFAALGLGLTGVIRSAEGSSAVSTRSTCRWPSSRARSSRRHGVPARVEAIANVLPLTYFIELTRNVAAPQRGHLGELDGRGRGRRLGPRGLDRRAPLVPLGAARALAVRTAARAARSANRAVALGIFCAAASVASSAVTNQSTSSSESDERRQRP